MEQEKKEGLIGGILLTLFEQLGSSVVIPFIKKKIAEHEEKTPPPDLTDKLSGLSTEQLIGVINNMAKDIPVSVDAVAADNCGKIHQGECGVCVGGKFYPC